MVSTAVWIGVGSGLVLLYGIGTYNGLVSKKNVIKNGLAQIDVQLKRRADLIPNLIESVKGYMKHEKELLENITKARSAVVNAGSMNEKVEADNQLGGMLKTLFAVSENYPKLRANENFLQMQDELVSTENKVGYSRQHYNDMVLVYNTAIQTFPSVIIARLFNFKEYDSFTASVEDKKAVKVKF